MPASDTDTSDALAAPLSPRGDDIANSPMFLKMKQREEEAERERMLNETKSGEEVMEEWLERAGWKEEWDQDSKKCYYYHEETRETRWEMPSLEELQKVVMAQYPDGAPPDSPRDDVVTAPEERESTEAAQGAAKAAEASAGGPKLVKTGKSARAKRTKSLPSPRVRRKTKKLTAAQAKQAGPVHTGGGGSSIRASPECFRQRARRHSHGTHWR